jgi:hypothetical protein
MVLKRIITVVFCLFILAGCESSVLDGSQFENFFKDAEPITIATIATGSYANNSVAGQHLVIRDQTAFEEFWNKLYANREPMPALPDIDFDKKMILGAVSETKPTGGYSVRLTKAGIRHGQLGVKVEKGIPGSDCVTTQALSTPYHLVQVQKLDIPVEFYYVEVEHDCS